MRHPILSHLLLASGLLALTQLLTPTEAAAEARLALVIGQSAYRTVPELPNAANDAKGMTELLGNAGFTVTTASNLAQNDMRQAISDFAGRVSASGADTVALVFYAGHGLQIDGENYLVPVDLDPRREADIPLQGVRLNDLLNTLGALPTKARIFMLDACRNNPFPALSGAGHGLAIVDTKAGAQGTFISYSTSPGAEAEDGSGADSPYTTAALSVARQPNLPIEDVFKRIRVAVAQSTDGRQIPWESSSLTTDFKFFGEGSSSSTPAVPGASSMALAGGTRSVADWRKDLQGKDAKVAYELVITEDTVEAYQAYVELYTQASYTPRLRTILERRRQMLAWERATAINTRASFEAYLNNWDNSDLAATARRLLLRVQNRNYAVPVAAAATPAPVAVAMAPTCPCSTPSAPATPVNPAVAPAIKKRVDDTPPKRKVVDTPPKQRRPPPDELIYESAPPPGPPPEAIGVGIGIGIGMGMGGRGGYGGGGYGGGPPRGDNYRSRY
ncbi:caspase family protein [Bradyrhizobium diazoefficiens]|nr:caspase family protein [Bradyrhizobium diazoefficiens]UCF53697.1 MAG: caspase family protein [Bradyrhizobium sp.]MBR0963256.1 caspase family protein [Bradyrhizobium diazoefficiens]MBR0976070.1 caspase family protein [Bradyrhizobium diazoefficiens]MBR1006918.1 caspase family protein [Bradyrhizobium diazoefficiens]MBR1013029.1 caspase family protein [Bradyrhizobium diazoefficiens]